MTTRNRKASRPDLEDSILDHGSHIKGMLKLISDKVDTTICSDNPTWGDAGDLAHIEELLTRALFGSEYRDGESDDDTNARIRDKAFEAFMDGLAD